MAERDIEQNIVFAKAICRIAKVNTRLQELSKDSKHKDTLGNLPFASQDAGVVIGAFDDERLGDIFLNAVESVEEEHEEDGCKTKAEMLLGAKGIAKKPRRIEAAVKELVVDELVVDESVVDESVVDESVVDESVVDESVVDESNLALMLAGQKFRMWLQRRYPLTWKRILWEV